MKLSLLIRFCAFAFLLIGSFFLFFSGYPILGATIHFVTLSLWLWGTLRPSSKLFGKIITDNPSPEVLLTFDDGPDPIHTPQVLRILKKHQIQAIFFLIGEKSEQYPDLVQQIYADGHIIGNHTWSHPAKTFWISSPWKTFAEISKTQRILKHLTGVSPLYFRAPVGHSHLFTHPILAHFKMKLMAWNCRGFDTQTSDADLIWKRLKPKINPQAIILLHDTRATSPELTSKIIQFARREKFQFPSL